MGTHAIEIVPGGLGAEHKAGYTALCSCLNFRYTNMNEGRVRFAGLAHTHAMAIEHKRDVETAQKRAQALVPKSMAYVFNPPPVRPVRLATGGQCWNHTAVRECICQEGCGKCSGCHCDCDCYTCAPPSCL